jgi:hypothetical protein
MEILSIIRAMVSHEKLLILLFPGIFGLIFLTLPVFLAVAVVVWFLRRTSSIWGVTFGLVCGL